uniref:Uncharacterized protein n=1 Tax=Oryza punctata TaxID=4537 RepID=A0A0E0KVY5_ORYPU
MWGLRICDRIYGSLVPFVTGVPTPLQILAYLQGSKQKRNPSDVRLQCLTSTQSIKSNITYMELIDYLAAIAKCERQARICYSEDIKMDKKKFLKMLLLDGCFVLVFLNGIAGNAEENPGTDEGRSTRQEITSETTSSRSSLSIERKKESNLERKGLRDWQRNSSHSLELCEGRSREPKENAVKQTGQEPNGSNGMGGWYSCCLAHDLLLFENQIPFYIVEGIYELFAGTEMRTRFLTDKIVECMESILRHYPIAIQEFDRPKQFHHLLHLCHMYFRPSQKFEEKHQDGRTERYFYRRLHFGKKYLSLGQKPEENQQMLSQTQQLDSLESESVPSRWRRWRRAVQYHEALTLDGRVYDQQNRHSLLDVEFSNGVIEIPCLPIDENTEALFKNLIALEQTDPRYGNDLTAYVSFMSQLVTTPDDTPHYLLGKGS